MDGRMTFGHSFFIDARDGFFEEGRARGAVLRGSPRSVATGAGVGERGGGGGGGRGDIEDSWGSEGEEVVGPFLCRNVSHNQFERSQITDQGLRLLSPHHRQLNLPSQRRRSHEPLDAFPESHAPKHQDMSISLSCQKGLRR